MKSVVRLWDYLSANFPIKNRLSNLDHLFPSSAKHLLENHLTLLGFHWSHIHPLYLVHPKHRSKSNFYVEYSSDFHYNTMIINEYPAI